MGFSAFCWSHRLQQPAVAAQVLPVLRTALAYCMALGRCLAFWDEQPNALLLSIAAQTSIFSATYMSGRKCFLCGARLLSWR